MRFIFFPTKTDLCPWRFAVKSSLLFVRVSLWNNTFPCLLLLSQVIAGAIVTSITHGVFVSLLQLRLKDEVELLSYSIFWTIWSYVHLCFTYFTLSSLC